MIVIADSSALISLSICDSLYLLNELFKDVKVAKSVYNEVVCIDKNQSKQLKHFLHDKIIDVSYNDKIITDFSLGLGEIDSMLLYKQLNADYLLIDDKRARKIANFNEIKTIGSLGILILAKEKKIINEIRPLLIKIYNSDIYIKKDLCNFILKSMNEKEI